jgi:outer membrane protein
MKNISLAINATLAIAVAILFYLHFSTPSSAISEEETTNIEEAPLEDLITEEISTPLTGKIGYINIDSLQDSYQLYEVMIDQLEAKQKRYEREMKAKSSVFEKKVQDFQKQAPTMSQFEGQMKQKELGEEEQKLYKMRDDFAAKFQEEEIKLNDQFQKKVKSYIQKHNKTANYDIIIGASELGAIVLDYNKDIDITLDVVKGLNDQYKEENTKK